MPSVLVIGAILAIIGAWNVIAMPWTEPGRETLLGIGLIFNMLLFILPGLVVYGIGAGMARRRSTQPVSPIPQAQSPQQNVQITAEERLSNLQDLKQKGLISQAEYDLRRQEIISEL